MRFGEIQGFDIRQVPTCDLKWPATRWSATLSSKVNLHHAINFRAVSKDTMAPPFREFEGG